MASHRGHFLLNASCLTYIVLTLWTWDLILAYRMKGRSVLESRIKPTKIFEATSTTENTWTSAQGSPQPRCGQGVSEEALALPVGEVTSALAALTLGEGAAPHCSSSSSSQIVFLPTPADLCAPLLGLNNRSFEELEQVHSHACSSRPPALASCPSL